MAGFKTHIGGGVALGLAAAGAAYALGMTAHVRGAFLLTAAAVAFGSAAPDIDSDSGVPFHVTFGALALAAGGVVMFCLIALFPGEWLRATGWSLGAALAVWVGVGWLFKRFTRHRGMAHSVPAALLGALVAFIAAARLNVPDETAFLAGAGFGLGYILHLVLDEAYATVDFEGRRFAPKKSLGSALKLASNRPRVTVAVYLAVAVLAVWNFDRLSVAARALAAFMA